MKSLLIILGISFISNMAICQNNRLLIKEILEESYFEELTILSLENGRLNYPNITDNTWNEFFGNDLILLDSLKTKAIDVYEKHLSNEDLIELQNFQNSRLGKKLSSIKDSIVLEYAYHITNWMEGQIDNRITQFEDQKNQLLNTNLCKEIYNGNFFYIDPTTSDTVKVERNGSKQIEYLKSGIAEYEIIWNDQCSYDLKCISYIDETHSYMHGITTQIQVLEINNEKVKFIAYFEPSEFMNISYLYKIE